MIDTDGTLIENHHATTVAVGTAAAMIVGPSGSGKSALALELIGMGAKLISDDISRVALIDGAPVVLAPDHLQGVIEARGVGLIQVPWGAEARLHLVVDMSENQLERFPRSQLVTTVVGCAVERVLRVDAPYFASALYHLLNNGRFSDTN